MMEMPRVKLVGLRSEMSQQDFKAVWKCSSLAKDEEAERMSLT